MINKDAAECSPKIVRTGIEGLDNVLFGGLPCGHLYLVEGDPGTGKTTLALQFLLECVRAGESCLYVTLSESKLELLDVAKSHGWSLDGIHIYEMAPQEEELSAEAQYTVFHPADVELADATSAVLKHVEKVQPTRVVFDSLSELRLLAKDSLRYRRQILTLKRFFEGRNCTVLLLDDRTAEGHDLQLQSIAHGVVIMESLARDYGTKRRRLEVRKVRGAAFREGFHDYTIQRGGLVVYPRLVASEHNPGFDDGVLASGVKHMDELVGGGLDIGTSTLMMGPAGSGKSTIAVCYAVAAAKRGQQAAIFCFDETSRTLLHRSRGLGLDLQSLVSSGDVHLQQIDPAEISPGAFVHSIRELVDKGCKVLVIDSLNGFLNAMPGEQFLILQLHEMVSYLNQQGVTTIFTMAQHGFVGGPMQSPIDVSYLADTVLLFRYFEDRGAINKAISVVKKRSGRHEQTIRELVLSKDGISLGPTLENFQGILTGVPTLRNDDRRSPSGRYSESE